MESQENILKLKKTVMIDGEEKTEIQYDFDSLTGRNVNNAFSNAKKKGYAINSAYEMDPVIGCYMFAEAAGISYEDVERMSAADYAKAGSLGRNFFIQNSGITQLTESI